MNLFQLGEYTLSSGVPSAWKIDCDLLTESDLRTLALLVREVVGPFSSVEGVPRGGVRLAEALTPYVSLVGPHLIVDDVLTTGGSLQRAKEEYDRKQPKPQRVRGCVLFARGQCPAWVAAVFQMPPCLWVKPKTRGSVTRYLEER